MDINNKIIFQKKKKRFMGKVQDFLNNLSAINGSMNDAVNAATSYRDSTFYQLWIATKATFGLNPDMHYDLDPNENNIMTIQGRILANVVDWEAFCYAVMSENNTTPEARLAFAQTLVAKAQAEVNAQ